MKDIDATDKKILSFLVKDSRHPIADMAKKIGVSSGTVHARIEKLKQRNVITGSRAILNPVTLGFQVTAFIGLNLQKSSDYEMVLKQLRYFDEVIEAYYTTGGYSLLVKIMTRSIQDLHVFLLEKLQSIDSIQSTETLISLDMPIDREFMP